MIVPLLALSRRAKPQSEEQEAATERVIGEPGRDRVKDAMHPRHLFPQGSLPAARSALLTLLSLDALH